MRIDHRVVLRQYLQDGETGLFGQDGFLIVARVGVVAMVVQPFLEQPDRLFGQIASAPFIGSCLLPGTVVVMDVGRPRTGTGAAAVRSG